jgi:DnaJ-class molecular chaperone
MRKEYYAILGVPQDATQQQIEAVYRARMRELEVGHLQQGPPLEVQEAYSVLSNPNQRTTYDESGFGQKRAIDLSAGKPPAEPLIPSERPADLGSVSLTRSFRTFLPSFEEIYDRFWSNFTSTMQPKSETLRSLAVDIPITPEQAITGGQARVLVPAQVRCPACDGHGGVGHYLCWRCDGRGILVVEHPVMVSFPAGFSGYTVRVPLDRYGIHNFYLTVHFRMTHGEID